MTRDEALDHIGQISIDIYETGTQKLTLLKVHKQCYIINNTGRKFADYARYCDVDSRGDLEGVLDYLDVKHNFFVKRAIRKIFKRVEYSINELPTSKVIEILLLNGFVVEAYALTIYYGLELKTINISQPQIHIPEALRKLHKDNHYMMYDLISDKSIIQHIIYNVESFEEFEFIDSHIRLREFDIKDVYTKRSRNDFAEKIIPMYKFRFDFNSMLKKYSIGDELLLKYCLSNSTYEEVNRLFKEVFKKEGVNGLNHLLNVTESLEMGQMYKDELGEELLSEFPNELKFLKIFTNETK
ncbi:hypothetical protein BPT24_292 [Tenacibaculum phage pT24]|uniref:Uncharacterized protein n=1 Tax=Tenacibaculum phage pT24 TaxID=1880590 RepID=A0A1B4XX72_9CAUD|nr:hypothetical protein HYP10_gp235 [Tenacibaculum phage pT24]BAV39410.1 hypothetical protein BPT24_292 [Tenacibaculum phage pT24]